MNLKTVAISAFALLAGGAIAAAGTSATAQTFPVQTVIEDSTNGWVGAIPGSAPALMVASDGESHFDPFGAGFDTSDGIQLNSDWGPDPAFAAAFKTGFWTQLPGTFTWVLPACNSSGCENSNIVEPIARWDFLPGGFWGQPGDASLRILESDRSFSDKVTIANNGPGGEATVTFQSGGVPEPAMWALMLSGFGLAGAALRRRTRAIA
jgi:hypothetical protein